MFPKKSVNLVYAEFCLSGTGIVPSKPNKQNFKILSVMSNFSDFTKVHPHEDCNNKYFLKLNVVFAYGSLGGCFFSSVLSDLNFFHME